MTTKIKTATRKASTTKGRAKQATAAKTMDSKAKHTGTLLALAPIAKEINHKLEQATKTDAKADDYRLSAALRLAEAKARCETDKLGFKQWAEENVTQSYETVRKLAVVGAADDPKLALEDMRGKNKVANKKLRDKKASEAGSRDPSAPAAKPQTPIDRIESGLAVLDDQARLNILESAIAREGMAVVTKENARPRYGEDAHHAPRRSEEVFRHPIGRQQDGLPGVRRRRGRCDTRSSVHRERRRRADRP